jgi:hypothetical protein
MKKQQLLQKLEQAWALFNESYAGLSAEQLVEPGVTGDWSVKDILAHVTWWDQEALKHLPYTLQDVRPPRYKDLYGGIDAFNAQMTEQKRGQTLSEVQKQLEETHLRLVEYLQSVPEEQVVSTPRFARRLRLDTYGHYPIHTQAIIEWRERSS